MAALVAVALDLPRELVGDQVQRVQHIRRGVAGAQRDALQVQRRLDDVAVGYAGVALLVELELEPGQIGDLAGDLAHPALRVSADVLRDLNIATLDGDLHRILPSVEMLPTESTLCR